MQVLAEAKRRGVLKVATVYLAVSWLTLEVGHTLFNIFELPHLGLQIVFVLLTLGFPAALAFGWFRHSGPASSATHSGPHEESHHEGGHVAAVFGAVALLVLATAIGIRFFQSGNVSSHGAHAETSDRSPASHGEAVAPASPEPAAFAPPAHSIGVLPFANLSGDTKEDYFSDGLSEELLNSLTRVRELRVPARTSSFSFKGTNTDIQTIARKLNVGAILEGSVRKDGQQVRIAAQLVDIKTGYQLWSQSYDRPLRDILALQSEIAQAVTHSLQVTLLGDLTDTLELGGTQNPEAFDAYLRGLMHRQRTEEGELRAGIAALDTAIRLDPDYALAYAGLAEALTTLATNFSKHPEGDFARAKASAQKAIALAPNLGDAHAALGRVVGFGDLDFQTAGRESDIALKLAPGNANVQRNYALFAAWQGRADAVEAARRAVSLDPLSADTYRVLIRAWFYRGEYAKVIASSAGQNGASGRAGGELLTFYLGYSYLALDQNEHAVEACIKEPVAWASDHCLAIAYHRVGRHADAEAAFRRLQAGNGDSAAYQYAQIYAQWGKPQDAMRWLRKAYEVRDPGLVTMKNDVFLAPIQDREEYRKIRDALKFPD